jgi:hypothetical protein
LSVAVLGPALYETTAATGLPPEAGVSVNVDAVTVAAFIGSLNVTTTSAVTTTPVALFSGLTAVTVGDITSAVVNEELKAISALPATSVAALVTLTV